MSCVAGASGAGLPAALTTTIAYIDRHLVYASSFYRLSWFASALSGGGIKHGVVGALKEGQAPCAHANPINSGAAARAFSWAVQFPAPGTQGAVNGWGCSASPGQGPQASAASSRGLAPYRAWFCVKQGDAPRARGASGCSTFVGGQSGGHSRVVRSDNSCVTNHVPRHLRNENTASSPFLITTPILTSSAGILTSRHGTLLASCPVSSPLQHSQLHTGPCIRHLSTDQQRHQQQGHDQQALGFVSGGYDIASFPPSRIRNFCIIAHVDHGKSTLADRLMELTGALPPMAGRGAAELGTGSAGGGLVGSSGSGSGGVSSLNPGHNAQYLDKLQVERERGITVKAQTASLVYRHPGDGHTYLLNLIDTPGHVDFSYEVSRSLAACQGALLVVDAAQGIQAQTVANFYLAFEQGLDLVPVINKVDLPAADPQAVAAQLHAAFDLPPHTALPTSAKTGRGVAALLPAVVERIRPPPGDPSAPLRCLLFDATHDEYRGVVLQVEVVDGPGLAVGDRVALVASPGAVYEVQEVGIMAPERHPTGRLLTGQVGYVICGIKDLKAARVGDTLYAVQSPGAAGGGGAATAGVVPEPPPPLPGFRPAKSMVFAGLFPLGGGEGTEFDSLAAAMDKLLLNDSSVVVKRENSDALGPGFRCGFLGMLHMEIFVQRLQHEYGAAVVATTPTVPYTLEMTDGTTVTLTSASEYPLDKKVSRILEPTVTATLITPDAWVGKLMELCQSRRGELLEHVVLPGGGGIGAGAGKNRSSSGSGIPGADAGAAAIGDASAADVAPADSAAAVAADAGSSSLGSGGRTLLRYRLPLTELASDFYSTVKSRSQGYASLDYEEGPYRLADLVRLDVIAHGQVVDALCRMVPRDQAATAGRALLAKMTRLLDRQQFEVVLQAAANGKIVARETLKAMRKNVTAKCYGGDVSRKRKLLERQKEGKRRLKRLGAIDVPQEAFPELMKTR